MAASQQKGPHMNTEELGNLKLLLWHIETCLDQSGDRYQNDPQLVLEQAAETITNILRQHPDTSR
jgi:hypothetical protein